MYNVNDKTTYYFVDKNKGKTHVIGNFDELISFLSTRLNFRIRESFGNQRLDKRDFVYDNWDFSGGDTHWVKEYKLVYGCYYSWVKEQFITGWHYTNIDELLPRPYMIVDDSGRIIDFREWEDLIVAKDESRSYANWGKTKNAKYGDKLYAYRYSKHPYYFRQTPVPNLFKYWHSKSYIHKGILNLLRMRSETRPKARVSYDYWDSFRHLDKNWKTNTKCRHQWQKNLKKGKGIYEEG